jgi:diguanylate cyclase (GGDEF)-like protein
MAGPEETRLSGYQPPPTLEEGCLVVIHAPVRALLGARLPLRAGEATLGRDAGCDLVLEADDVSRRHARVRADAGRHVVEDLGSTNGTWVGDDRLAAPRPLASGDHVRLGSVVLKYLAGDGLEALYHAEVRRLAEEDPLTGLANRGAFTAALGRELARARRHARPLSLLLLDLDHFKAVNDRHGHPAGDAVLRAVAAAVGPLVRPEELFARIGGEELALVLPDAPLQGALAFGEKIRRAIEALAVEHAGATIRITVSIGAAVLAPDDASPDALVARADAKLYEAKQGGRNRVCA